MHIQNNIEEVIRLMPQFKKRGGLLPVAVQETSKGSVLMLASANEEALNETLETGLLLKIMCTTMAPS